jgi:histidinol-phosphate aminotransferase
MGIRANIQRMSPYKPPLEGRASRGYLLLDFNEMTIPPSPGVRRALKDFVDSGRLQAYPEYGDLDSRIALYAGVEPSQAMATNGSDQGIDVIFRACVEKGGKAIIPTPSFAMFYQSAGIQGAEILEPHYREDLSFPLEETLGLIDGDVKLVVVCNPNNPTGTAVPIGDVKKILEKAKGEDAAVLHDEAYFEFSGITAKALIPDFDNLFVTRTLSKQFGIASVRPGYVLSQEQNIGELLKIRGPYDVNMFAATAIRAALDDADYARSYIAEIMGKSKSRLEAFFRENNVRFWPGAANFLLVRPDDQEGAVEALKSEGILVRPREGPNIEGTFRVSIGTLEQTERFIDAYRKFLYED